MDYTDILYTKADGIATITINRPKAYNAFTANTCEEMIHAFKDADYDRSIGVVVLTGAGEKAFCTGGDQGTQDGGYGGRGIIGLPIEEVQSAIRDCSKPVIAIWPSPPTTPSSARLARASARSIPVSAPPSSPASSAKRRLAKSGICAAATAPSKPSRWAS